MEQKPLVRIFRISTSVSNGNDCFGPLVLADSGIILWLGPWCCCSSTTQGRGASGGSIHSVCYVPDGADLRGSEPMTMNPSYKRVIIGKGPIPYHKLHHKKNSGICCIMCHVLVWFAVAMLPVRYVTARAVVSNVMPTHKVARYSATNSLSQTASIKYHHPLDPSMPLDVDF